MAAARTNGPDASVVRVAVQERDDRLHPSIRNDGVGGADPARGSGLIGLRDRGGPGRIARAAAAGPFDADQAHGPEPAQPAQQAGVSTCGSGEPPRAREPPDRGKRCGDMDVGVGVHAAGDGACLYDGRSRPNEGWHAPAGRRSCEPRPLAQARQIRPAALAVARKPGPGRQIVPQDSPNGVSRIGGQAETQAPALLHQRKTVPTGPEALPTSSLPIMAPLLRCPSWHAFALPAASWLGTGSAARAEFAQLGERLTAHQWAVALLAGHDLDCGCGC